MSGGHFDYQEARLVSITDQLKNDIEYNDVKWTEDEHNYGHQLEPKTIVFIKEVTDQLNKLEKILHEYDLAISGDTCEKTFQERVGIK